MIFEVVLLVLRRVFGIEDQDALFVECPLGRPPGGLERFHRLDIVWRGSGGGGISMTGSQSP